MIYKNVFTGFLCLFFILMSFLSFSNSVVGESFSQYHSFVNFTDEETIVISKQLALKNNFDKTILPGQIEFRIGKGTRDSVTNANLENVKVYDKDGNNISYSIRENSEYTSLILDIYYPLLPKFEYKFFLQYELEFEASGIFFKSLEVPLKETSIPIENGTFKVHLPKNSRFTYLGDLANYTTINKNEGIWQLGNNLPNSVEFEYSFIPIRTSFMRGSYVFWLIVNVLMFTFLVYEIRKELVSIREEEE